MDKKGKSDLSEGHDGNTHESSLRSDSDGSISVTAMLDHLSAHFRTLRAAPRLASRHYDR